MLSFFVANLLIPGDPNTLALKLPSGSWTLTQHPRFAAFREAISRGQSAETYYLENTIALSDGAALVDAAMQEITAILLAASFATGLSVTIERSTMASEAAILRASDHWPRARGLAKGTPVVSTADEFKELVEALVLAWPQALVAEKTLLLIHHWLDALSCWSMEDMYLSATTLLQIISATEADRQAKDLSYYDGINGAASRVGIRTLSQDFKNMRNTLIHEGHLIGSRFAGPDKPACARVVVDVMNWFDEYVHAALALGSIRKPRFSSSDLIGLNAYSI